MVNIYHEHPKMGHKLHHLLNHDLDKLIPTLIIGDFNTHAIWWFLSGRAPSAWADDFTEWLNTNNLLILNPPDVPTWQGSREGDYPSILDHYQHHCNIGLSHQ